MRYLSDKKSDKDIGFKHPVVQALEPRHFQTTKSILLKPVKKTSPLLPRGLKSRSQSVQK